MDEETYRLQDVFYAINKETGKAKVFLENTAKNRLQDLNWKINYVDKAKNSRDFATKYGFDKDKYITYTGKDALKVLDHHPAMALSAMPKTYLTYKTTRPTYLTYANEEFAMLNYIPVRAINRIGRILEYDYKKQLEKSAQIAEKSKLEKAKENNGRDF